VALERGRASGGRSGGREQWTSGNAGFLREEARRAGERRSLADQTNAAARAELARVGPGHEIAERGRAQGEVAGTERRPSTQRERVLLNQRRARRKRTL
jgi:hypothetical protein